MSIDIKNESRSFLLRDVQMEAADSGLLDDMRFRPNKFFHQIEDIKIVDDRCIVEYHHSLAPIEGRISTDQIKQTLWGVIDANQRIAESQVLYLYPDVDAFGLNSRKELRVGLLNVRPSKDEDRSPQQLSVDAFLRLIAGNSPKAEKKVRSYRKPIHTLRELQQVLDHRSSGTFTTLIMLLLFLFMGIFFGLHQWGPPKIQKRLHQWTSRATQLGERVIRSGSEEWNLGARETRLKKEYRFAPIPLSLVLTTDSNDNNEVQKMDRFLRNLLATEFPDTMYQLTLINPILPTGEYQIWKNLCSNTPTAKACSKSGWLLQISKYRGGIRPLLSGIQEAMNIVESGKKGQSVSVKFLGISSMMSISYQAPKAKRTKKTEVTNKKDKPASPQKAPKQPQNP